MAWGGGGGEKKKRSQKRDLFGNNGRLINFSRAITFNSLKVLAAALRGSEIGRAKYTKIALKPSY